MILTTNFHDSCSFCHMTSNSDLTNILSTISCPQCGELKQAGGGIGVDG